MRHLPLLLLTNVLTSALINVPAWGQTGTGPVRLLGFTLDHWRGAVGPALLRPTFRLTMLSRQGPGAEFAAVVFPDGISLKPPGIVLGLQGGVAQPVAFGPVTVLAKAGGAGIAVMGLLSDGRFLRFVPGVQAGLGLLLPVDRKSTLRLDVTRHHYDSFGDVWSFGVGFSARHRRTR